MPDLGPSRSAEKGRDRVGVVALSLLAIVAVIWLLSWAKGLLIPLSFAMFLTICLTPTVNLLARAHVPRSIGAALVLIALSLVIAFVINHTRDDAIKVTDELPHATRYLQREINAAVNDPGSFAHRLKMLMDLPRGAEPAAKAHAPAAVDAAAAPAMMGMIGDGTRQVFALTSSIAAILFLVYLMLATSGRLQRRIAHIQAIPLAWRNGAQSMFGQIQRGICQYLGVVMFTNVLVGLSIWGAFRSLDVQYAGVWGVASAVMHFVPYVGPALIAVGSGLFTLVQADSLARALLVAASSLVLSSLLGVVLQTWLSGRSAGMNIVAVFVSLMFWAWIWGLAGLLLGTPITMTLKIICSKIPSLEWIDALLDGHGRERRDAVHRIILRDVKRVSVNQF